MQAVFFSGHSFLASSDRAESLVCTTGAIGALWTWHRFDLPYAQLAAMIFVSGLPGYWTSSHAAQHVIVAVLYAAGLFIIVKVRRGYRFTYFNLEYSIAEALLWLGIYVAMNLQLSSPDLLGQWWGSARASAAFPRWFYWTTWVLTWCLPPVVLARGLRQKDRLVIAAGAIVSMLTLITNKPYLSWPRHVWDLMLLGALLIGVALFIRRWLAGGPGEVRSGFTARRLSGKEKSWLNVATTAIGTATPGLIAPRPESGSDFRFGGGDSGGGGASSEF